MVSLKVVATRNRKHTMRNFSTMLPNKFAICIEAPVSLRAIGTVNNTLCLLLLWWKRQVFVIYKILPGTFGVFQCKTPASSQHGKIFVMCRGSFNSCCSPSHFCMMCSPIMQFWLGNLFPLSKFCRAKFGSRLENCLGPKSGLWIPVFGLLFKEPLTTSTNNFGSTLKTKRVMPCLFLSSNVPRVEQQCRLLFKPKMVWCLLPRKEEKVTFNHILFVPHFDINNGSANYGGYKPMSDMWALMGLSLGMLVSFGDLSFEPLVSLFPFPSGGGTVVLRVQEPLRSSPWHHPALVLLRAFLNPLPLHFVPLRMSYIRPLGNMPNCVVNPILMWFSKTWKITRPVMWMCWLNPSWSLWKQLTLVTMRSPFLNRCLCLLRNRSFVMGHHWMWFMPRPMPSGSKTLLM